MAVLYWLFGGCNEAVVVRRASSGCEVSVHGSQLVRRCPYSVDTCTASGVCVWLVSPCRAVARLGRPMSAALIAGDVGVGGGGGLPGRRETIVAWGWQTEGGAPCGTIQRSTNPHKHRQRDRERGEGRGQWRHLPSHHGTGEGWDSYYRKTTILGERKRIVSITTTILVICCICTRYSVCDHYYHVCTDLSSCLSDY